MSYLRVRSRVPEDGSYTQHWRSGRAYPTTWRLWAAIEATPNSSIADLAAQLGTTKSGLYPHILRLRCWGVLPEPAIPGQTGTLIAQMPYRAQSFLTEEERHVENVG